MNDALLISSLLVIWVNGLVSGIAFVAIVILLRARKKRE
jgi:hypothetical protein